MRLGLRLQIDVAMKPRKMKEEDTRDGRWTFVLGSLPARTNAGRHDRAGVGNS